MFVGSIPEPIREMLGEHVRSWTCRDVYIGCSGNFTVERVLASQARFDLHSNDVSLYTCILGALFAGQPFRIALTPDYHERMAWLEPYLTDTLAAAATIMLSTRLADTLGTNGEPRNSYYARLFAGMRADWPTLHRKTVERLEALGLQLASFWGGDVADWPVPDDAGFISYPPFYDTYGAGYAALYRRLERVFEWDRPTFEPLGGERLDAFIRRITDRQFWLMGVPKDIPALAPYLRGLVKTTNINVPVYVYGSLGASHIITPDQKTTPVAVPRLMPGQEVGDVIKLANLSAAQFNALRSQYLNADIPPAPVSVAYAVLVDGCLIGAFAFSVAPNVAQYTDLSCIYLLSDFAVAPTDYTRLAKLVLVAALSRESKLLAERVARRRIRRCVTTAFSHNPVSMKYRGLLNLVSRKKTDPAKHPGQPYQLAYQADMGGWSLAEGLALWRQKHGRRLAA